MPLRPTSSSAAGFTINEVLVAVAIGLLAVSGMTNFVHVGLRTSQVTSIRSQLDAKAERAIAEITRELGFAAYANATPRNTPPISSSFLEYQRVIGQADGELVWGPRTRIELADEARDPEDGIDNDDDGLVDEKRVLLITDPGSSSEHSRVIVTGVAELLQRESPNGLDDNANELLDESGLCFTFDETTIYVRLTLQQMGPGERVYQHTVETAIVPRN